jgi:hypothetical protein
MRRPLLIEPGSLLVFPAGHEFEVMRPDAGRKPASVIRLVPGRDPPAVVDLPHHLVAAADLFSYPHERIAVLIGGSLIAPAAGWRLDAIAMSFCQRVTRGVYFMARGDYDFYP